MNNSLILAVASLLLISCSKTDISSDSTIPAREKWISEVIEYRPAPGQFINTSLGNPEAVQSIIGDKNGTLSLGSYGGYVIFRFNHDVENKTGVDFVIKSNAFVGSSEPAMVAVSYDSNGNGIADDKWYELAGEGYSDLVKNYTITWDKPQDIKNASNITWHDNKTGDGVFDIQYIKDIHTQCYYPLFLKDNPNKLTFTGTLIPQNGVIKNNKWVLEAIGNGYACNMSSDWNTIVEEDEDTRYSNKFDISDAVDENGNKIDIKKITFIKVYTAVHAYCGALGETSTEICGAISMTKK